MCIGIFMWQAHPRYPFLLLLNRDEFHSRPTKAAGWWEGEEIEILGGRDELAGGTWLACSKRGRLAFLTNFRGPQSVSQPKSRGELPLRFLKSQKNAAEFADEVNQEADQYNAFNLILVDFCSKAMVYVTNRPEEDKPSVTQVSPGIHVLTNANLDSPWPKAQRLLNNFKELMSTYGEQEVCMDEMVEKLMRDPVKADRSSFPSTTIYPPQFEYELSSIYIDTDTRMGRYGTRSTSAVLMKVNGEVCFHERYLEEDLWKEHTITYQIG